jgi:hypothetical protein
MKDRELRSESVVESADFNIITKEGSVIELTLDVENLNLKMSDGSKVSLERKSSASRGCN